MIVDSSAKNIQNINSVEFEPQPDRQEACDFLEQAQQEVMRRVEPFAMASVIERLAREATFDIDVALGFSNELIVPPCPPDAEHPVRMVMSTEPMGAESSALSFLLDSHWRLGDRTGLYDSLYCRNTKGFAPLQEALETSGCEAWKPMVEVLRVLRTAAGGGSTERERPESEDEDLRLLESIHSLGSITGEYVGVKLGLPLMRKDGRGMEYVLRAGERLLRTSRDARRSMLLYLQGARLLGHNVLAEALVRQGFRTFRDIHAVTEHESRQRQIEAVERSLDEFMKKEERDVPKRRAEVEAQIAELKERVEALKAKRPPPPPAKPVEEDQKPFFPGSRVVQLEHAERDLAYVEESLSREGEPPREIFMNNSDLRFTRASREWFLEHAPQPPTPLREVLRCKESREELERLRTMRQWDSLGAKELEVASRVCGEVFMFPYQGKYADREDYRTQSFAIGTPRYVLEHRHLTCFTGAWLIAAMCLESGIRYEQLFYCNAHQWKNGNFGEHDALLLTLSNGNMCFLDFGFHKVGRTFTTAMIPDQRQRVRFRQLLHLCENMATLGHKITGDPVHVQVPKELMDQLDIFGDFHVLPLDQGLTATMLLHTGIGLAEEGKHKEALLAYELGLTSNPSHPDLLCRAGAAARLAGEYDRAERLLRLALSAYENHLVTWYELGILALTCGQHEDAKRWFTKVAEDKREVWSGDPYKKQAKEYLDLCGEREELERGSKLTRVEEYLL